jgi:hypothetical protein
MAQVTVGSILGMILTIYSVRVPLWHIYVDAFVQFMICAVSLNVDPKLVYALNSMNNLSAWWWWGEAFQAFVCIMVYREWKRGGFNLNKSFNWHMEEQNRQLEQRLQGQSKSSEFSRLTDSGVGIEQDAGVTHKSDMKWLAAALVVLGLINFWSFLITRYGWWSQTSDNPSA